MGAGRRELRQWKGPAAPQATYCAERSVGVTSFSPVTTLGGRLVPIVHMGLLRSRKLSDQLQVHSLWLQPVTTLLHVSTTWATAAVCCGVMLSP